MSDPADIVQRFATRDFNTQHRETATRIVHAIYDGPEISPLVVIMSLLSVTATHFDMNRDRVTASGFGRETIIQLLTAALDKADEDHAAFDRAENKTRQ